MLEGDSAVPTGRSARVSDRLLAYAGVRPHSLTGVGTSSCGLRTPQETNILPSDGGTYEVHPLGCNSPPGLALAVLSVLCVSAVSF